MRIGYTDYTCYLIDEALAQINFAFLQTSKKIISIETRFPNMGSMMTIRVWWSE